MADTKITRTSLKTNLADKYTASPSPASKIAKTSDHVDVGNRIQNEFKTQTGVTSYTERALNHANDLGVPTEKYKG